VTALTTPALDGARLLAQSRPAEARLALLTALGTGDDSPATQVNLALAEEACDDAEAAGKRLAMVAKAYPEWDEPHLRLAEIQRRLGNWPAAEQAYRDTLDRAPDRPEALIALGAGLICNARPAEALAFLRRACAASHPGVQAWHALGLALLATNDPTSAEAALTEAQSLAPSQFDIALQRADAAHAAGHATSELSRLDAWSAADPLNPLSHQAKAHLLRLQGQLEPAIDCLEIASQLCPTNPWIFSTLGALQAAQQQTSDAEQSFRRALDLDPKLYVARYDLAAVLIRLLRFSDAEILLTEIIADHGATSVLLSNLASALIGQGRQAEAVAAARRATTLDPGSLRAWRTLTAILPYSGTAKEHLDAARACARRFSRSPAPSLSLNADPSRPLRLALLSDALRTHPVGWLTVAGIEALDPAAFEVICLGPHATTDPFARRFAARAAAWHDTTGLDDEAVAMHARGLRVDILLDLGGHGEAGRLGVAAHRAAPVQIKWVGAQAGTTGLSEMDCFLADRWGAPADCEPLYTEHVLRLQDGYVCYSPPTYAPAVAPLPALQNGRITFGCFNNLAKITPDVLATWSMILGKLPTARLLLKAPQLKDAVLQNQLRHRLTQAGINLGRVTIGGPSGHRAHLHAYADVDIALDPFPYSGGLSTCEALWMGVPTVTLPGQSFASRHTMSHQENAGVPGWSATTRAEYVDLAIERSADLTQLAALRAALRARTRTSPLCDAARFGNSLGSALRRAWRARCLVMHAD